jgi:RNA polymerase sigma-70 factor (ECF subfamily)
MEKQIIERIIEQDSEAFTLVYNQYCNKVYSIAFSVLGDEFDAEDVMQEIFIELPKKLNSLKKPEAFDGWLYKMTKNKAIDYTRKRKDANFSDFSFNDEESDFSDNIESEYRDFQPEENYSYEESKQALNEIINKIPEEQRECVMLRYSYGMSLKEIAQRTNAPLSTVKSRLKYAKAKIESEVEGLEKNGVKLYAVSGLMLIPFLRWMLSGGKKTSSLLFNAATGAVKTAIGAGVKGIIASVVAVAVIGTAGITISLTDTAEEADISPTPSIYASPIITPTPTVTPIACYTNMSPMYTKAPTPTVKQTPAPTPTVKPKVYAEELKIYDTDWTLQSLKAHISEYVNTNKFTSAAPPGPLFYDLREEFERYSILGYYGGKELVYSEPARAEICSHKVSGDPSKEDDNNEVVDNFILQFYVPYKTSDFVKEAITRDIEKMERFVGKKYQKVFFENVYYDSIEEVPQDKLELLYTAQATTDLRIIFTRESLTIGTQMLNGEMRFSSTVTLVFAED